MDKKTKIVATIGPASESREILKQLIEKGINVARLNFSHGDYASNIRIIENVRSISQELDKNIGIMADLQGPRIRILLDNDVEIKSGEEIYVSDVSFKEHGTWSMEHGTKIIYLDYPEIIKSIEVGNEILIEDGLMKVRITEKDSDFLKAEVIDGGIIKNEKGVNIPDADLKIPVITSKDEEDLLFALGQDVDFIALSFVSTAQNIIDLRNKIIKILNREDNIPKIVAKIERKEAIKNIKEIIKESDVIMVARGDLGIEVEESKVAILQKEIIAKSLSGMKPVIVATQMLDSMINNPRPTRAEVSDVSNAVIDHTDAVMLSGESANGKYPVEVVETMTNIIRDTENSPYDDVYETIKTGTSHDYVTIVKSAYELSKNPNVKAILVKTLKGVTANLISHFRPSQPILVATNNQKTFNQLSMVWGTKANIFETENESDELIEKLIEKEKDNGILKSGDKVVVILGKDFENREINLIGLKEIN